MNPNQYPSSPSQGFSPPAFLNGANMNNMNMMGGMGGGGGGMNNMGMNSMNNMSAMGGMGGGMGGGMAANMGGMGGSMGGMGGSMGNMAMQGGMNNMNSMNQMGMGNMGGMGGNMSMNAMSMGNMGGMRPQGGVNPQQLMGAAGGGGGGMGMSPAMMQQRMAMAGQGGMGGGAMGGGNMGSMNAMSPMSNPMSQMSMGQGNMGNMGNMGGMSPMGQNSMPMNQGSMSPTYPGPGSSPMSPTGDAVTRPGTSMSMNSNTGGGGGFPNQGGMGGGGSMNMGGMGGMQGGMNASSPPASQGHQQPTHQQSHGQTPGSQSHPPTGAPNMPNAQVQAMLLSAVAQMGYSNEQFRGLPPNERNMLLNKAYSLVQERVRNAQQGGQGMGGMQNQGQGGAMNTMGGMGMGGGMNQGQMPNHNQGQPQPQPPHERPLSSASTHSQHEMMPPPPRPGTSMSMSRPGTAMGHPGSRPGTAQGAGQPGMGSHARSVSGSGGPPSSGRASVPPGSPRLGGGENVYPQQPPTPNQTQPPQTPKMGSASSPTRPNMQQSISMPQIPVNGMVSAGMTPQGMAQSMMGRPGSASSLMGANPMMGMGGMNPQAPMNVQSPMAQGPHQGLQRHGSMPPPQTPQTPTHPQGAQMANQPPQPHQTPHPPNQRQSSLPPPVNANKMGAMTPGRMQLPMPGSQTPGNIGNMSNSSMENLNAGEQGQTQPQLNGQVTPVVKQGSVPPPSMPPISQQSSTQSNISQTGSTTSGQAPNSTVSQPPQPATNNAQSQQPQQQTPSNGPVQTRLQQPPPLPSSVSLNPNITRVTLLPLLGSDKAIPQLTEEEIEQVKAWMKIDEAYEGFVIREGPDGTKEKELGILKKQRERMAKEARECFGIVPNLPPGAPPPPPVYGVDGLDRTALNAGTWWERGGVGQGKWFNPTWEWLEARYGARSGRPVEKRFDVRYPGQWAHSVKKRDAQAGINQGQSRGRYGRDAGGKDNKAVRREGLKIPRKLTQEDIDAPEELVPIRLEFDVDHHKMRDSFVWNLNDPVVTPESFAQSLVEDYGLPSSYHSQIVKQIQDQLSDYKSHSPKYTEDGDPLPVPEYERALAVCKGGLGKEESKWWERWRKRLRGTEGHAGRKRRKLSGLVEDDANDGDDENDDKNMNGISEDEPMELAKVKIDESQLRDDFRIIIKIDIIVGSVKLDDQFEWDIDNISSSPELFAETYAQDLGLSGEFKTAIAHSIREQVQTYQKSLYLVGRPTDGSPIQDEDLRQSFLPPVSEAARSYEHVSNFTPRLDYLSDNDLERNEKERDKEYKRRKRNTRGRRGVNLPDREPIRTCRTPALGFNDTGETEGANAANSGGIMPSTTRRAAAAAASLTIANMVASENGSSPIMGQATLPGQMPSLVSTPQPQPQAPPPPKKVIPKGLFKAPPVPSEVLRPRAKVAAPTPSTALDSPDLPSGPPDSTVGAGSGLASSRNKTVPNPRKAKELEREAKEKEFVDGQHPNFIDGVWHCSNCGCPESIAVGRRKGPLGDKSQCGTCGKYWHRHRRPRPVEYNTDPDFHLNQRDGENLSKSVLTGTKRGKGFRGGASGAATPEPSTPMSRRKELASERETPSRRQTPPTSRRHSPPTRVVSPPLSSASSADESLALKVNGTGRGGRSPRPPLPHSSSMPSDGVDATSLPPSSKQEIKDEDMGSEGAPPSSSGGKPIPAPWLIGAMEATQSKYPNDRFELTLRKMAAGSEPEWRIKCSDCPGKLYKPGPGETLSNFEVHLKNRQHRQRVDERAENGD